MEKVQEVKEMIEFLTKNNCKVKVRDFRTYQSINNGVIFTDKVSSLQDYLRDIVIYREDSLDKIYAYLKEKSNALKELLSIQDGSIFDKNSLEVCSYAESLIIRPE